MEELNKFPISAASGPIAFKAPKVNIKLSGRSETALVKKRAR